MTALHDLSIVIPALDEAERLPLLLADLDELRQDGAEIVVVDGGSRDGTVSRASASGASVVRSEAGRGEQLRAGAGAAGGSWIFFLHADSRLDPPARRAVRDFLRRATPREFAHLGFALDGDRSFHRFIEFGQRIRERLLGLVYGDQGLLVSRHLYDVSGGYPAWTVMEDVELMRRLAEHGRRVRLAPPLRTSPRRYDEEGGVRRWLRNVGLMALFRLGVPARVLARWYRPRRAPPAKDVVAVPEEPGDRSGSSGEGGEGISAAETSSSACGVVGVFAKAPAPGRVKTRLAADVGDARAVEIYRKLGRATVDRLRRSAADTVVFVDPPDPAAFDAVREWLGDGLELRPQSEGDLGQRMHAALSELLSSSSRAVLVGTDIPGIDERTVESALGALLHHDVVVGPATDGGYYLIGMTRPRPELFVDMPWSTEAVLPETLGRAEAGEVSVALLETKTDVDTSADLPAVMRREP